MGDSGSVPVSGKIPCRRAWPPTPVSCWRFAGTEDPGGLQSTGWPSQARLKISHFCWLCRAFLWVGASLGSSQEVAHGQFPREHTEMWGPLVLRSVLTLPDFQCCPRGVCPGHLQSVLSLSWDGAGEDRPQSPLACPEVPGMRVVVSCSVLSNSFASPPTIGRWEL